MSDAGIRGERYVLRRGSFREVKLGDFEWKALEDVVGLPLPLDVREQIKVFADLYAFIGPMYSQANTVLASEIVPALASWLESTNSLLERLKVGKEEINSKADFLVEYLHKKTAKRIAKALPLEFLAFAVQSAAKVGAFVLKRLTHEDRNLPIENDLWSAWVCLTTQELEKAGVKITGASVDKSHDDSPSPFIRAIMELQSLLPEECQHFGGYESVRKGTQQSIRAFGEMRKDTLLHLLAGWGAQLHTGYPGSLRRASPEKVQEFEETAQEIRALLAGRISTSHNREVVRRFQRFAFPPKRHAT